MLRAAPVREVRSPLFTRAERKPPPTEVLSAWTVVTRRAVLRILRLLSRLAHSYQVTHPCTPGAASSPLASDARHISPSIPSTACQRRASAFLNLAICCSSRRSKIPCLLRLERSTPTCDNILKCSLTVG